MHCAPSMAKHSPRVSNRNSNQLNIDALLESLFAVSDSGKIDASFDGLVESRSTDSDQEDFIERSIHLGSVILEAGKRSARKRATVHNTSVWPLPSELTVKVFSMVDTRSSCSAAATCSFFQKCTTDPLCYSNIDLATLFVKINVPKLNNAVASTMIERAGKALESIKLVAPHNYISNDVDQFGRRTESPILTVSCLSSLNANGGALGSLLRSLHLHRFEIEDEEALAATLSECLSVCPSLVELKFEGMFVPLRRVLESVSRYCHLLECFILEFRGGSNYDLESSLFKEFVLNCPKITTLTLQACGLLDPHAFELVKILCQLRRLSQTHWRLFEKESIGILQVICPIPRVQKLQWNLGTEGGANSLEIMILHGISGLCKVETENFMTALLVGNFRLLKHLDISESGDRVNNDDPVSRYFQRNVRYAVSFFDIPIRKLLEQRPNFCMVVEYNKSD